jgi:hypothetical protein
LENIELRSGLTAPVEIDGPKWVPEEIDLAICQETGNEPPYI